MKKFLILTVFILSLFHLGAAHADIIYGGYTFDDNAFADQATNLDSVSDHYFAGGATDVNDALSGFSPTKGLYNIGCYSDIANLFQLDFTDLYAVNNTGADIVFFEARYSSDPYEISVREVGGSFTSFVSFSDDSFVNTGETAIGATAYALAFDLSNFGLSSGAEVDAMRFRALQNSRGLTEGDPVMAGVLNSGAPVPEPATMLLMGTGLLGLAGFRRKYKKK